MASVPSRSAGLEHSIFASATGDLLDVVCTRSDVASVGKLGRMVVLGNVSGGRQSSDLREAADDLRGVAGRRRRRPPARSSTSPRLSGGRHRRRRLALPSVPAALRDRLRDDRLLRERLLDEPATALDDRGRRVRHAGDGARRRRAGGGGRRPSGGRGGGRRRVARRGDRDGGGQQRRGADDDTAGGRVRRRRRRAVGAGALDGLLHSADARPDGRAASAALHRRATAAADRRREAAVGPSPSVGDDPTDDR